MSIKPFPAYAVETAQPGAAAGAVNRAAELLRSAGAARMVSPVHKVRDHRSTHM
jgi:hypothetical protein